MIVDPDLPPPDTTYYLAARALQVLSAEPSSEFDLATVITGMRELGEDPTADSVVLALDFLFLLGRVKIASTGVLVCD